MTEDRTFQIYGLGQCSLDYLGKVEGYPPPDVKCEFSDLTIEGGGPVATALVALSRWGISCTFSGVLGDDYFGELIRTSLDKEGVDTQGLLIRKGFASQFAFIVAEPGIARRTIFWRRPTGPPPTPGELNLKRIRTARIFHTDGLFPEASLAAATTARKAGVQVVVDAGTLREGMLELAQLSDCYIASAVFARALIGKDEPREACSRLAELGPRLVGVTLGSKGYIALESGKIISSIAYPVQAIDTTGCGDVFHAGFIYGLLRDWDSAKSFDFASWTAAQVSLRLGGRAGIPPLNLFQKSFQ
jgi:sulfofructose kinase